MEEQFNLGQFEKLGRYGDDTIAHVATGERVIPNGILDSALTKKINARMKAFGLDPDRYIVGNNANSLNPHTGKPEFFDVMDSLFGSSGDTDRLENITNAAVTSLDTTPYATTGVQGPFGNVTVGPEGISVNPSEFLQGITDTFGSQFGYQTGLMQPGQDLYSQLLNAYQPSPHSRQDLEQMFTAGLPSAEASIAAQTDSTLGRLLGGLGTSTGSAGVMAGAQREADLAKQALRQNALTGASTLYNTEMDNYTRNLLAAQDLRRSDVDILGELSRNQLLPYQALYDQIRHPMTLGNQLTQFDLAKIENLFNVQQPLASLEAQDTSGIFSSGGDWFGGLVNAGLQGANLYAGLKGSPS